MDAKEELLAAAERLVAEHGPDGVSMRDIAKHAGQRNNSAVSYHFGGRDGLLRALFAQRMESINVRRAELLAASDGPDRAPDLRALVEVVLRPLAEHVAAQGTQSTYAQFMTRVIPLLDASGEGLPSSALHREVGAGILRQLPQVSTATAVRRLELVLTMAVSALAGFEQRLASGTVVAADLAVLMDDLVDMGVAALQAPERASTGSPS